ncbi:WD40-repeat-containing domain protein [Gigaspora rosea]|uniref:WD40-repeat-containing domain protein n=1 Tax=Gigaspora rosea TaxID=44941 RepID=A0A397U5X3_9GLOM|nr:WD40-repeat-containing domain protein [Gigaspora rosea]
MEPPIKKAATSISSERDNIDKLTRENKTLKQKVDILEKENMLLKKSIYDLTVKYTAAAAAHQQKISPFMIDFEEPSQECEINLGNSTGKILRNNARENIREGRTFHQKSEFKGHGGGVSAIQFSPCGKMLASGSFDKTVRIWDAVSLQKEQACLKGHTLNVSDVCWSNDSRSVLSGAYDQTCKFWDVETSKYTHTYESEGFVQCVMFNPQDNNIFVSGSSRKVLAIIDIRKPESVLSFKDDGMINSLYVCRNGQNIITGDSLGYVKTWDIRTGSAFQSFPNEKTKKPVSHIAVSKSLDGEEPRHMAVNSYDNLIRIYDRGIEPPKIQPRLIHILKGYKNKGWPIRSSFFLGKDCMHLVEPLWVVNKMSKDKSLEESLLLATGSADPYATGELLQRLEGHTDFVYAVDFHPFEPILASCSADFTIKIWVPNARGKKKM